MKIEVWILGKLKFAFNPIPAEVLENQDMLGGGQIDPPPAYPGFQVPQQG